MGTMIRSDGFRLSLSGISITVLLGILGYFARMDAKADRAIESISGIRVEVSELRKEMAKDRDILHEHGAEIREHRAMIRDLQRRTGAGTNAKGWGDE